MFTLPYRLAFILMLLLSVLLLTGCGGGGDGSGGGSGKSNDSDGDGYVNSVDVDDDNDGLIEITSLQQLDWMRNDLAGTSLTDNDGNVDSSGCPVGGCHGYELVAELDFDTNGDGVMDGNDTYDNNGSGWLPIGDDTYHFTADFNGNGHTIRNLYINRPTEKNIGLFGVVNGTTSANIVQNVNLENILVTGYESTGGLIGFVSGSTISTCSTVGAVTGAGANGGLIGWVQNSTISHSSASGTVTDTGKGETGGLAGKMESSAISSSTASGAVTGESFYTGGLVGSATYSTINNSSASGAVTGKTDSTGGLIGSVAYSTISTSSASGAVTGNYVVGGLVAGANYSTISKCTASGVVTNTDDYTGGLVGDVASITISNSSARGAVVGNMHTGGLVGQVNTSDYGDDAIIESSFATGSVTATTGDYVGGLIGISRRLTLNNSFATGEVVGRKYVGGLIGDANIGLLNVGTRITHSFATGKVSGTSDFGALVGWSDGASYSANYFANDKGIANALGSNHTTPGDINPAGTTGATLVELQCPTTANNTTCAASLLYQNWDTALWDFGSDTKLPGLIIDGTVYRDGNGDGVLD